VHAVDNPAARHVGSIDGAGRDIRTDADGRVSVLAEASIEIAVGHDGTIVSVHATPNVPEVGSARGARLGAGFRRTIGDALVATAGTPLGVLLGDLSGSPAGMRYGLVRRGEIESRRGAAMMGQGAFLGCAGHRAVLSVAAASLAPLPMLDAPLAPELLSVGADEFHPTQPQAPGTGRRIRCIDCWLEDDSIVVGAFFRDTNRDPGGVDFVVHEYAMHAAIDRDDSRITTLRAEPHVLPFNTCVDASEHIGTLIGERITDVAIDIHSRVSGEISCTHLNDMVRFLADVPAMVGQLGG